MNTPPTIAAAQTSNLAGCVTCGATPVEDDVLLDVVELDVCSFVIPSVILTGTRLALTSVIKLLIVVELVVVLFRVV